MLATGNWGVALTRAWAVREWCEVLIASNRTRILKDAYDRVSYGMPCSYRHPVPLVASLGRVVTAEKCKRM